MEDLDRISREVRTAAHEIIAAKKATYYGIGMAIVRVARAVLENENSVLTVSVRLRGEYGGKKDVFLGNPAIIGSEGAKRMLELKLTPSEQKYLENSYNILNDTYKSIL